MLPHLSEAPAIEVRIVQSFEPPGGMGEAGTSAVVPAVTNAVFAAPIITVIGGLAAPDRRRHWLSVAAEVIVRPLAVPAGSERPGTAAQMVSPATGRRSQRKPGRRT